MAQNSVTRFLKGAYQSGTPIMAVSPVRSLVKSILKHADDFAWSLQGFGMLRLHVDNTRVHVWDDRYAVPNVSVIHDHLQWALRSTIMSGALMNILYDETPRLPRKRKLQAEGWTEKELRQMHYLPYNMSEILAGPGGGMRSEPKRVWLMERQLTRYEVGETYVQNPSRIHESRPARGTVTLMEKFPTATDLARVFWPEGTDWVSAEPRPATLKEIEDITGYALSQWDAKTPNIPWHNEKARQ